MNWVVGTCQEGGQQKFLMLSKEGHHADARVEALATHGTPTPAPTERVIFTGDLSSWVRTSGDEYLQGFDIQLPAGMTNRHSVFIHQLGDGITVHVPALVLIRALFRPHRLLLPIIFTPGNVDLLGFVDYSRSPPAVVLDAEPEKYVNKLEVDSRYEPLRWLHSSGSARISAQSVYTNSLNGHLDLCLPHGEFRLVLHGLRIESNLFVTKMTATSVSVPPVDCVTKVEQAFIFHRMASSDRKVTALSDFPSVPVQQGSQVMLTDVEWQRIEPLLGSRGNRRQRHCRRDLLDAILQKLSSGRSWKSMTRTSGISKLNLTTTFRRWHLDGRFSNVLAELALIRRLG